MNTTDTDFEPRNIADEATAACYAAPYGPHSNGIVNQIKHNRGRFVGKPLAAPNYTIEVCGVHGITLSDLLALATA